MYWNNQGYPQFQNPYQNPNNGYYQPQQNAQIQQPYPQSRNQPQLKLINTPEEIMPGDVPMDGSMSFFAMNDHSSIFGKCWDRSGNLQTVKFVREQTLSTPNQSNDISERLSNIENQLAILTQSLSRNNYYKKGGMKNERRYSHEQASGNESTDG